MPQNNQNIFECTSQAERKVYSKNLQLNFEKNQSAGNCTPYIIRGNSISQVLRPLGAQGMVERSKVT